MSKRIRSWLFIVFIVLFILGTTIISLYASGYKLNMGWPPQSGRLLIKTGMIIVDSQPSGALIYLDDKPQTIFSFNPWNNKNITTAAKLRNVPPGEHKLRLEKDGYLPWEKKIRVEPNQATTLSDVNLFRSDLPQFILAGSEGPLSLSSDNRYLYINNSKKIVLLRNNQEKLLPEDIKMDGQWLAGPSRLFSDSRLFSFEGQIEDYRSLVGTGISSQIDEDNNRLYYEKDGAISYLNLSSRAATLILQEDNILAYQADKDAIWALTSEKNRTILKKYPLPSGQATVIYEFPSIGQYNFYGNNSPLLSLYDSQNKTLYLINKDNPSSEPITIKRARSWQWVDKNTLLYNNDWEIYSFNISSNNSSLLTRVGEEIKEIVWHKERGYIILATADSLQIYDPRLENITKLLHADKISTPVLDADNNILYFWAKIGQQTGIYKMPLQ